MTSTQLHTAVQRARCWTALSLFAPYASPDVWEPRYKERIAKLSRWHREAFAGLGDRKVSSRAAHCMDDMMSVMTYGCKLHSRRDIKIVRPEDLMITFVAVAHLLIDCRIVCKKWTKTVPWRHLDAMAFSLLKEMIHRYPYSEEPGVAMYERFCEVWDRYAQK